MPKCIFYINNLYFSNVVHGCNRYPPFPEAIAFGKDCKKQGIACHHPKLLVLQRQDSIRVIITSANLVANQVNTKPRIIDLCFMRCLSHMIC